MIYSAQVNLFYQEVKQEGQSREKQAKKLHCDSKIWSDQS